MISFVNMHFYTTKFYFELFFSNYLKIIYNAIESLIIYFYNYYPIIL